MKSFMKVFSPIIILLLFSQLTLGQKQIDAQSRQILDNFISVVGSYDKFRALNDVEFHYVYDNFDAGRDVSDEKFIFDGESSWARYTEHKRNVLPNQEGIAEQSLINGKPQLTLNGKFVTDETALGATTFLREVNPFWFSMIYKLEDNSTIYKYLGTENVDGTEYDKVSLTYDNGITQKPADDEYILYFHKKTHMLDLFYFSLPAFGIQEPILKMEHNYEKIDGVYIATVRKSYAPNPDTGEYSINGEYTFSKIKFNNGFKPADFVLKGM